MAESVEPLVVKGYEAFKEKIAEITSTIVDGKPRVFVLFSGTPREDGTNWCPDCEAAEPFIKEALKKLKTDRFVYVHVGDREYWKNPECPFRTDPSTLLVTVPTLVLWGGGQRLEEDECCDPSLLEMLFNESK